MAKGGSVLSGAKGAPPPTPIFCKMLIPGDFKSNDCVRADSKGLAGAFFVRVDWKGLRSSRGLRLEVGGWKFCSGGWELEARGWKFVVGTSMGKPSASLPSVGHGDLRVNGINPPLH